MITGTTATGATHDSAPFADVTRQSGLDFVHFNGMTGQLYFVEMMGPGGALLDFDGDGDLDIYLVQGAMLGAGNSVADSPVKPAHALVDRLYRNDTPPSGGLKFTDVTTAAGVKVVDYGMGAAVGDVNNDGLPDIYVTNFGPNRLLLNRGAGRFDDVTDNAGVAETRWSVSASFIDFDRDGWLDLYVANYVAFDIDHPRACFTAAAEPEYCGPTAHDPEPDRLFRNRGDGTFEDVSRRAGIAAIKSSGLGVVAGDFDADGWLDLYVTNDALPNNLWINQRDGRFVDEALLAGAALNMSGAAEASMGVDAADFDHDGDLDLFMTHLGRETNTLYINQGPATFEDRTVQLGLAGDSLPFTGFGTRWFDYDRDGLLDLFVANGAVIQIPHQRDAGERLPLRERNQLFRNLGSDRFEEVTAATASALLALEEVTRGTLFGDLDSDGDVDLVLINNAGPARIIENRAEHARPWLGLSLVEPSGRDALGARVVLMRDGKAYRYGRVRADGSYAAANDPRVLLPLKDKKPVRVQILWPDGSQQDVTGLAPNRYHRVMRKAVAK